MTESPPASAVALAMPALAVAAVSARWIAEAAACEGFKVVALDVFGDADTRRASTRWHCIGDPAGLRIDPLRTLAALRELAARRDAIGWLAGSGFDGLPNLLEAGAQLLPLLGTAGADVRRLRHPKIFFGFLQRHGLAHPPVAFDRPADPAGWLRKDAAGSGGWHILPASDVAESTVGPAAASVYFQRASCGVPMSATFIAGAGRVSVLGINRLLVQPRGSRPFVFRGVIGPLPVADGLMAQVDDALRLIGREFRLRGLGSLDFLFDGETARWLEVNPRLPASAVLYDGRVAGGLIAGHLAACRDDAVAGAPPVDATAPAPHEVRGIEIVFAPRRLRVDAAAARAIAEWPGSHDQPAVGTRFAAGDPLCSVSAAGGDGDAVARALAASSAGLLQPLDGCAGALDDEDDRHGADHDDNSRLETTR